ncbi:hypothetical protein CR513_20881, partial [Mucuna pruriens]
MVASLAGSILYDDLEVETMPSLPANIKYLSFLPLEIWTSPPREGRCGIAKETHGSAVEPCKVNTGSRHLSPPAVVPWNMLTWLSIATGVISSHISENKGLNLNKYGSLHVVPSGHTTRSPCPSNCFIILASSSRFLVNRTVFIGASISDILLRLYVTAVKFFCSEKEMYRGSSKVLWLHTYRFPTLPFCLIRWERVGADVVRRIPLIINKGVEILNGSERASEILITARIIPYGSHINIAMDSNAVGLRASLPS